MRLSSLAVRMLVAGISFSGTSAAWAQTSTTGSQPFPVKPVRIVVSGIGGGADVAARLIGQGISGPLGQQVVADNRGDAAIASEVVAKAAPDGYTLLLHGSTIWLLQFMRDAVPWDPIRDFAPITLAASSPNMLVVHPSLPVKSVRELIALAKGRPGELNFATSGTGNSNHLAGELFKSMAAVNIVRVNYKGAGQAVTDLIGGQVQLMFPNAALASPLVKSGKLRALGVTSAEPSTLIPGIPSIAVSGLPGYESVSILGIFAPIRTPAAIVSRLNQEIVRSLHTTEMKEKFMNTGVEAVGSTPEQLLSKVKSEISRLGSVIRQAGIRDQ